MNRVRCLALALGAIVLSPAPAQAVGFGDAAMAKFTKEDHALSKAAMKEALDSAPDGQAVKWSNPATKAAGSVTPLKTTTENGLSCRLTQFDNEAKGQKGRLRYKLCKLADGSWKVPAK